MVGESKEQVSMIMSGRLPEDNRKWGRGNRKTTADPNKSKVSAKHFPKAHDLELVVNVFALCVLMI